MENKLYSCILFLLFSCCLSAGAQDTTLCNANFNVSVSGNQATFQAVDTHGNIQHYWNFGDTTSAGFNSNLSAAYHTYSHSGVYTVIHIIRDSLGGTCFDSSARSVTVNTTPSCTIYLQAQRDTFNAHYYDFYAIIDSSGGVHDSITWFVNDSYAGTGPTLLHYYFSGGLYTVCARLITSTGCMSSQCQQIQVAGVDSCRLNPSFSYVADSSHPQRIHFTPSPDSSGYSYFWNFGDGYVSADREPVHDYVFGGSYNVSLTVAKHTGMDSCQSTVTEMVYVTGRPSCSISFTYTRDASNPNEVIFNAVDSAGLDSLTWVIVNLADSLHPVQLYGQMPSYVFPDSGCYWVMLSATTPWGCQRYSQQTICMDSIPSAARNFINSYPNPAAHEANLNFNLTRANTVRITVFNSMGNPVLTTIVAGNMGQNHVALPISNLPRGVYYVQIQSGNETRRSKFQKL